MVVVPGDFGSHSGCGRTVVVKCEPLVGFVQPEEKGTWPRSPGHLRALVPLHPAGETARPGVFP